jgi:hypothetical protein
VDYQFISNGATITGFLGGNRTSTVNQVNDDGTIYFVTGVTKLRDLYVTDGEILYQSWGSPDPSILTVPASTVQDATVPLAITIDWK